VEISWHEGERERLRSLFALAEDSPQRVEASIGRGRILVAREGGETVGLLQLVETDRETESELLTLAVRESRQRRGIGSALVGRAIDECRREGVQTLLVATAAAETGNLRFYQLLGFRMLRIQRDAYTATDGYPDGLTIDGIPVRDRVWLSVQLAGVD
jgi:GNAT superfamily N-acetyltransferase